MDKSPESPRGQTAAAPMSLASAVGVKAGVAADAASPGAPPPPRLLDRMCQAIRVRHFSIRTEQTYVDWARRYIVFPGKRHPQTLGPRTSKHS